MIKFNKTIREIQDNNEFFNIDYEDVLRNFDTDDDEEKVTVSMKLSLVNVAFLDAVRGDISRPRFIDRLLTIFRTEFINDIKFRVTDKSELSNNDTS